MKYHEMTPLKKPVTKTIEIPGSKSYTNRALVMAALTKGKVILEHPLYSEDTEVMIGILRQLGLHIETKTEQIVVHDDISVIQDQPYDLYCKDSGTTIRFLLAMLCLTPGIKILRGSPRLNERPIKELVEALRLLGAKIDQEQPPLKITSSSLSKGRKITLDASMSSQFLSALLMIAPLLDGLKIDLQGELISKPYVKMTLQAMQEWGVNVLETKQGYQISGGQHYKKERYEIEGDFSSAGYFFAIAALTKSTLTLKNLSSHSIQADLEFLTILARMGNEIHTSDHGITVRGKQLLPITIDMEKCPDQVQTMAVLAAFAPGITKISGVRSLRVKETERVYALRKELAKMGIRTEETTDTLTIYGGSPKAALIETYGDHRMAMAFAIAGTHLPGMKIHQPEVVCKTFPTFWEKLGSLSG